MDTRLLVFIGLVALAAVYIFAWYMFKAYLQYRGKGVVVCPETKEFVAVEVDATHAAMTITRGIPEVRLKGCSRWPERQDCGQEYVMQLELTPEDCIVRTMLASSYRGKACAFCGKPFGEINWTDHKPALLNLESRKTIEWQDIPAEALPGTLATHVAVCWNCHIAETFRREHPELVVERPWKKGIHV